MNYIGIDIVCNLCIDLSMADVIEFKRGDRVYSAVDPSEIGVVLAIVDYGSNYYKYLVDWGFEEALEDSVMLSREPLDFPNHQWSEYE